MATYNRVSTTRSLGKKALQADVNKKKKELEEDSTRKWVQYLATLPTDQQNAARQELAQRMANPSNLRPATPSIRNMRYDVSSAQVVGNRELEAKNRSMGVYNTEAVAYNPDTAHLPSDSYMKQLQEALGVQLASSRVQDDFRRAQEERLSPWEDWYYNLAGEPDDFDLKAMDTLLTGKEYPSWYELTADERTKLMGDFTRMKAQVEGDLAQATPYQSQTPTLQARYDLLAKEQQRRSKGAAYQEMAAELQSSPTFEEDSKYTPATGESYAKYIKDYTGMGWFGATVDMLDRSNDVQVLYDYIMNPAYAAEYDAMRDDYRSKGYGLLTADEKAVLAAAWAQSPERFTETLSALEADKRLRIAYLDVERAQQENFATANIGTGGLAFAGARAANLTSSLMYPVQLAASMLGHDDPYSDLYASNRFAKNVTGAQSQAAGELLPWQVPFTDQKLGEFLYNGVSSMADMGLALGIGGLTKAPAVVTQLVMSSQAASNTLNDALTQGVNPAEATVRSLIAGGIEALTERYSIDAFLANPKSILSYIGKNMLTEASEEGMATLLNTAADGFISSVTGRETELRNEYNALLSQGMNEQEASKTVLENYLHGLAGDVLLGGLTGGLMGGAGGVQADAARRKSGKTIADAGNVPQLLDIAATMGGESGEMGRALKQTREQGGKVSNRQVGRLYETMYKELDDQSRSIIGRTMQDAVAERLVELGDDEQLAQEVAEAIMPVVRNEKPSLGQTRTMARSQNSTQVIKELMYADDTTSEGRVKHSSWARTAAEKATSASASSLRKMGDLQATAVDQRVTDKAVKRSKVDAESLVAQKATDKKSMDATNAQGEQVEILRVRQTAEGAQLTVKAKDGTEQTVAADELKLKSRPVAEIVAYVQRNGESMSQEQANLLLHTYTGGDAGKHTTDFQMAYASGFDGRELGSLIQMDESIARQVMAQGRKDAQAAEEARQKTIGAISTGRRGAVTFSEDAVDMGSEKALKAVSDRLSDTQKKSVQAIKQIARVTGVNFVFFESQADDTGRYTAENGHYDVKTGTIYLDLNSGKNSTTDLAEYAILRTAGHELTHFMEHSSKEGYAALRDFVTTELTRRGQDFDALVRQKIENASTAGHPLTRAGAISEVVADASELMLRDSKAIERLAQKDQGLMAKIKGFIQSFVQKVRDAFSGVDAVHEEARVMMQELAEEFQQKWDFALEEAVEQAREGAVEAEPVAEVQEQFAMREPVEQRKDGLLAVHNLSATKLLDTLRLGGFPMPSIAIIKAKHGHDMYGPYSVVFGPKTIDPEADKANRVYGNDAWTPVFPRVEREVNSDALYDVEMEIHDGAAKVDEEMARKSRAFFGNFGGTDVTDKTDQDIADSAWNYDGILAAYLLDQGEKVVVASKEIDAERPYKIERAAQYDAILDIVDVVDYATMPMYELLNKYGDSLAGVSDFLSRMNERWKQDDRRSGVAMAKFISEAVEYEGSGRDVSPRKTTVKDYAATRKAMETQIDRKSFDEWINRKLAGAFGQQGIYNGTDRFTRSGNRRSFKQTHYDYTVENVVRTMLQEAESAIPATNASGLKAAASTRYGSIEEIRADSYRLGKVSEEQFNAMMAKADNDLHDFLNAIEAWDYDIQEDAGNLLVTAAKRKLNAKGIAELFKANGFKKATLSAARIAESVIRQVQTIPTGYLEAKPARVVSFDEVRMVVAPESIPAELSAALDDRGIPYTTYSEAEGDRLAKLNAVEDVQFSIRDADVSYDALVKKDDMELTFLADAIGTRDRRAIAAAGYNNVVEHGKPGVSGMPAIYVKDIDRVVHVSKKSLEHGLDRRTDQMSAATQHAGELLQHAILINTSAPKLATASGSYLLLSAGYNEDGTITPVSFVVNQFTNELEEFDVLKSMKTKKNQPRITAGIGAEALLPTDSTISISDLIDLVKDDFSDMWSNDVIAKLGIDRKPSEITSYLQHSLRDTTSISTREYIAAMQPTDSMTDSEKWLLGKYQRTAEELREKEAALAEQLHLAEEAATGDEQKAARNRAEILRTQANRLRNTLAQAERAEGFATIMRTSRDVVQNYLAGRNTNQVADSADALEAELREIQQQLQTVGENIRTSEAGQRAAYARGLFNAQALQQAASTIKKTYNLRMSAKALADRLALAYAEMYANDDQQGAVRFYGAMESLARDILANSRNKYTSPILDALRENIGSISISDAQEQELRNAGISMSEFRRVVNPAVSVSKGKGTDLSALVSSAEYYGTGLVSIFSSSDSEGDLIVKLYNVIKEERAKERAGTFEGMSEAESQRMVMVDLMGMVNLPLASDDGNTAALRKELLNGVENNTALAQKVDRIIETSKRAARTSGAVWRKTADVQAAGMQAVAYYRAIDEQRRLMELQEQKQIITQQLRSDAAKKLLAEQTRYREMIATDRAIRDKTRDAARIQEKIATRVRKLDKLRRHETDYKNVPEAFKPAVDTLVSMFTDSFGTMAFDAARADRLASIYHKLLTVDGNDPMAQLSPFYDPDVEAQLDALKELAQRDAQLRASSGMTRMEKATLRLAINKGILDAVDHITAIVKNAQDLFYAGKKAKFSGIGVSIGNELKARQDKKTLRGSAGQALTVLDNLLRTGNMTPVYFFERLGNNVLSTLWNDIRQGQNAYAFAMRDGRETIQDLQQRYHYWDWADSKRKDNVLEITTEKGRKLTFTREQALWVYATWKREQSNEIAATKHLTQGGIVYEGKAQEGGKIVTTVQATPAVLSEGDIASITGWLTDEQKAYADGMVQYLSEDMAELGNRASMEMFGIRKYTESYYFPYRVDGDQLYQSSASGRVDTTSDSRLKHTSFTHALTKGASAPLVMGDFSTAVEDHITRMATYASFVLPIESMNRVLNYKVELDDGSLATVRSLIEQKYGESAKKYIATLLTDLNGGVRNDNRASGTDYLIRMYKKGAVSASLSTALQQPTSIFRAMAMISPKYIAASTFSKRDWEELTRYSGVAVVKDMGRFDTDVGRSNIDWLHKKHPRGFMERLDAASGFLPEQFDRLTWAHLWNAVKKEQADLHPEMDKQSEVFLALCGERFNDIVDHTQVYDSILSRSQLMRGKDAMSKMTTSFMAEPTLAINMLYDAAAGIHKPGGKAKVAKVMAAVLTSNIAAAAMAALIQAWNDDDDERTAATKYLDKFLENALDNNNPLSMLPVVSDVWSMFQGYDVQRADMSLISEMYKAIQRFQSDSYSPYRKVEELVGTTAKFFGLSLKNLMRDGRRAYNLFTSSFESPSSYELSTALPWADDSATAHYEELFLAMHNGDKKREKEIRGYLTEVKGKETDAQDEGVRTQLKERFLDGSMEEATARAWLKTHMGYDNRKAFETVDRWRETQEHKGDDSWSYSIYNDFYEAVESGKNLDKEIKQLLDLGIEAKTLAGNITSEFKPLLLELLASGKTSQAVALQAKILDAYVALGYDREKKLKDVKKWYSK